MAEPRWRRSETCHLSEMSDGMGVVLDLTSREYYTLNPAGIVLWRCFDGRALCDKAQLLKHLEAAFAVPDGVAERDVDGFLQQLEHERLLERVADREP